MLSPIIDNWEKYEELNTKLAEVLEEQEKNPTVSGYDAICGMCKELETLNKIHKKKVELMEDFEDEDEDAIIETITTFTMEMNIAITFTSTVVLRRRYVMAGVSTGARSVWMFSLPKRN